ncbi:nitroreductase family protein [Chryseosolibacter indicus]|uniref:Putative NAD(P)H nitroreductase n=1 Tax=Chryseosolibacter indicus TaxID=2782351 RepID=A0ABS5VNR3_9BACT|nr:nitroreductase [Chryseosolibacter indicus]MBT1703095.1 nitroreductase [Chryseosolibacter indicus]
MVYDLSAFESLIKNRRSIFPQDYTGEIIEDVIVKKILETAIWAPTHKLTQPWRFVVFTGAGIKTLAEEQANVYKKWTLADGTYKEERYQNLLTKPLLSSHIIAVCMKRDEKNSVREVEEIGAVYCAVQNIYLAATAFGVGGYLSTGGITYMEDAKKLFGLEKEDRLIGFFHLGVPKRTPSPLKRKSLDEVMQWVSQ